MKKWLESREAKKITRIILILFVVLVMQIFGVMRFNQRLYGMSLEHSIQQVEELSTFVERNLYLKLDQHTDVLKIIATHLEDEELLFSDRVQERLYSLYSIVDFQLMGISDLDGKGIDCNGNQYNISYDHIRDDIEKDEVYISNVLKNGSDTLIFVAVPLKHHGEICGILWGKYPLSSIVDSMDFANDSYQYFQIIDDRGFYLIPSENKFALNQNRDFLGRPIWEELENYTYSGDMSAKKIYESIQRKESGHFHFQDGTNGRYVSYRPLKINNWYLLSVQVDEGLHDYVYRTRKISVHFFIMLTIGVVTIFGIIYNLIYTMYQKMATQNRRILAINLMLRTTLQQTKNIPFTIDHVLKQITFYGYPAEQGTQYRSFDDVKPEKVLQKGLLDPESLTQYTELYQCLIIEKKVCEPFIICTHMRGKKEWVRVRIISDNAGGTNQTIGVLEDYGEQREKDLQIETHLDDIKKIEQESKIDFLTKLYNRQAFLEEIEVALKENEQRNQIGALLILDLDHFKEVNDCLGHAMGDVVLQKTADTLLHFFRKGDIIGRLGGDEFVIFAPDIRNLSAFEPRIRDLNHLLNQEHSKDGKSVQVSASIGIMLTDSQNSTFPSLYEKADQALYQVKENGKNGYRFYSERV